ncbi:MAG: hypothetical protein KAT15_18150, partial [Bacteroidales bacterium]|nr:hypothetical protein [Bacteroidales bacterium]
MEIRAISLQDLSDYISGDSWDQADTIPITPERARSQQQNPYARPDDIVLWVATSGDGQVIGFAGSLPAFDVHNSGRMGWNTCWWVDPDRGKDMALPLFSKFLYNWDQHVAFADMTQHTYAIIDQLGFCHTRKELLIQNHIRLSGREIRSKTGLAGKLLYPLILATTYLINACQQI